MLLRFPVALFQHLQCASGLAKHIYNRRCNWCTDGNQLFPQRPSKPCTDCVLLLLCVYLQLHKCNLRFFCLQILLVCLRLQTNSYITLRRYCAVSILYSQLSCVLLSLVYKYFGDSSSEYEHILLTLRVRDLCQRDTSLCLLSKLWLLPVRTDILVNHLRPSN